jgi:hypothetical protein
MTKRNPLFLYEEIMLLALRDEEGTIASGAMYKYAIGGAVLAELLLSGSISVEESKKKKIANLDDPTPIGDPLLDECLEKIRTAKRRASLQTWVTRFSGVKNLKHRAAAQLCKRGILRADEDKVLLVFTRKIYPELDPAPERKLIERLREAVFTENENIDPRTVVLVSLANATGLLKANFDKKLLKGRKERIKHIVNGEMTGKATKDAIDAMHAAVAVAAIMPAMIAATTAAH